MTTEAAPFFVSSWSNTYAICIMSMLCAPGSLSTRPFRFHAGGTWFWDCQRSAASYSYNALMVSFAIRRTWESSSYNL